MNTYTDREMDLQRGHYYGLGRFDGHAMGRHAMEDTPNGRLIDRFATFYANNVHLGLRGAWEQWWDEWTSKNV